MNNFSAISQQDIEPKITAQDLMISRVIPITMLGGVFIFLAIVYYLNTKKPFIENPPISESVQTMIYAFIVLAVVLYTFKYTMLDKLIIKTILSQNTEGDPIRNLLNIDRQRMIIHLALLEAVALFGLVILFIEVNNGAAQVSSELWLLTIPFLILLREVLRGLPSREKIAERIVNTIIPLLKG